MGIIEQAAKRLDELRRAGVDPSGARVDEEPGATAPVVPSNAFSAPPETGVAVAGGARAAPRAPQRPATVDPRFASEPGSRSKTVSIDTGRLGVTGYLTPDSPRSQLADEFRVVKRPLLANVRGESAAPIARANLIMITSALPGEGKTFTAVNLAMSVAKEVDSTVLLVDADVARPSILERLGLAPDSPGLLDVLTDPEVALADVLLRTNVDKLTLLPAGRPHARATELLASDTMGALLTELSSRYRDRVVIFDAPPLLASTESRVLATRMGQIVLVVAADETPQRSVSDALTTLQACPVVMTVLNKARRGRGAFGDYGPYGYGYTS